MTTATLDRPQGIRIEARDVSGQRVARVSDIATDSTIAEMLELLTTNMRLPRNTHEGEAISYQALLEREGRHLNATERVRDALLTDDRVVLQPNIEAGAATRRVNR
ncbi:MAG: hypothetical protein ACKVX7_09620 [Planctomycetota bacterium]